MDYQSIVDKVNYLKSLSPTGIAMFFMRIGSFGSHSSRYCPVARYLDPNHSVSVGGCWITVGLSGEHIEVSRTSVGRFVNEFDKGYYPFLEQYEDFDKPMLHYQILEVSQ